MASPADLDAYYELIMQLVDEAGQVSVSRESSILVIDWC